MECGVVPSFGIPKQVEVEYLVMLRNNTAFVKTQTNNPSCKCHLPLTGKATKKRVRANEAL